MQIIFVAGERVVFVPTFSYIFYMLRLSTLKSANPILSIELIVRKFNGTALNGNPLESEYVWGARRGGLSKRLGGMVSTTTTTKNEVNHRYIRFGKTLVSVVFHKFRGRQAMLNDLLADELWSKWKSNFQSRAANRHD